jgi:predicted DNA binding CopG/RHH family protein
MKGAKGILDIPARQQKTGKYQQYASNDQQNAAIKAKWRKVTVRFEESFFKRLKVKLVQEGRTLQGYIDYLIRRDLEQNRDDY